MCFNPRSHGGSDTQKRRFPLSPFSFNPRSHGGSDLLTAGRRNRMGGFNPRSHGGSDHSRESEKASPEGFQSTLPRGERLRFVRFYYYFVVFQSTLPRGERLARPATNKTKGQFQSTLPRGERLSISLKLLSSPGFNPRSHGGSDRKRRGHNRNERRVSIHAPTGGATQRRPKASRQRK